MSNLVVLITGANRGIGFELTRQYLINEWTVIATCRNLETAVALISLKGKFPNKLFISATLRGRQPCKLDYLLWLRNPEDAIDIQESIAFHSSV
jgi:NAD(P)-dependent dehydrogenase (short-subunit alcohol dehydrogenase family)